LAFSHTGSCPNPLLPRFRPSCVRARTHTQRHREDGQGQRRATGTGKVHDLHSGVEVDPVAVELPRIISIKVEVGAPANNPSDLAMKSKLKLGLWPESRAALSSGNPWALLETAPTHQHSTHVPTNTHMYAGDLYGLLYDLLQLLQHPRLLAYLGTHALPFSRSLSPARYLSLSLFLSLSLSLSLPLPLPLPLPTMPFLTREFVPPSCLWPYTRKPPPQM
jgi:hypothetical protein